MAVYLPRREHQTDKGKHGKKTDLAVPPLAQGRPSQQQRHHADVRAELDEEPYLSAPVRAVRRIAEQVGPQQGSQPLGRQRHRHKAGPRQASPAIG